MRTENKKRKRQKGFPMIAMGLLLLVAALFLTAFNLGDALRAEQASRQAALSIAEILSVNSPEGTAAAGAESPEERLSEDTDAVPDYVLAPDMEMPAQTICGKVYIGVLRIPALKLVLPVISQWSYPSLRTAPCRYSGSVYQNNLILCGHNYVSHFGRLKKLSPGDLVTFTDMDGNVFTYKMTECETLAPNALDAMQGGTGILPFLHVLWVEKVA